MLSKMDPNRKISRHGVLRLTKVKRDNIESNNIFLNEDIASKKIKLFHFQRNAIFVKCQSIFNDSIFPSSNLHLFVCVHVSVLCVCVKFKYNRTIRKISGDFVFVENCAPL